MNEVAPNTLLQIDLGRLRESKTNPRGDFDKAQLGELTESVRTHGVLQAILVRPIGTDGHFEIVAGARRFRAARSVKLGTIPAQVREMSDDQVLEIQLIENLQRADIHPLDEANGYKRLVKMGHSVEDLAAQVSKSASYIYQRLKLAELIPEAQAAFKEKRVTAAHAVQIARLQPGDQDRALSFCFGVFPGMTPKVQAAARKEEEARHSVRELAGFIEREIHLDLNRAPFPVADALLVEKAGACTTCPKRTGFNPALFADIATVDTCTDPTCYKAKVAALVQLKVEEFRRDGPATPDLLADGYERATIGKREAITPEHYALVEKKAEACPSTRDAILASGPKAGEIVSACTDPKCKTHFDKDGRRRYPSDRTATSEGPKQDAKLKFARRVRSAILNRVLIAAPKKLGREEWNVAALALLQALPGNILAVLQKRHEWKDEKPAASLQRIHKLPDAEFARFVLELVALPDTYVPPYEAQSKTVRLPFRLELLAKRAKVNVASIERAIRTEKKTKTVTRGGGIVPKREKELHTNAKPLTARSRTLTKAVRKAAKKGVRRGKAKAKK